MAHASAPAGKAIVTTPKVTFALFGLGRAGTIHANGIIRHPRATLAYIVELDEAKAEAFVKQHELKDTKVRHPKDIDQVIGDPVVQAVMVASTTNTHEAIIRAAFKFQKPVFSEKPIAETVNATMEVCKLSTQIGVPLFCGFNRRSDHQFLEMYKRVREGHTQVGRVMMIKSASRDYPTNCPLEYIKISGGQFVDQTVHDIDICLWMAGERPHTVYAMGNAFYPDIAAIGDTDTVMLQLQFPSGVMATIDNSRRATFGYDTRLEIYGEKAMLTLENLRPSAAVLHDESGEHRDPIYNHFSSRFRDAYYSELDHFIDFIQGKAAKLRITADEAYAAVRVSKAAAESFKEKKPIHLEW